MKITDTLRKTCVRVPLRSREKIAVMTELVDLLDEDGQLTDRDEALKAVLAREKTRSTGIGRAPSGSRQRRWTSRRSTVGHVSLSSC
jgi:mannitol/fructose-specific phosphotransferase system IIA component (Ntr-type)